MFDGQPQAVQQEEGARNGMSSKVGHLLHKPEKTSHRPPGDPGMEEETMVNIIIHTRYLIILDGFISKKKNDLASRERGELQFSVNYN